MSKVKPSDKLKELQDYTSQLSLVVGVDFFDPQPKPNVRTLLSTLVSLVWQGLVIYTIIKTLPDRTVLTLAFVHLSFFSQGLTRTVNIAINPLTTTKLRDATLQLYKLKETDPAVRSYLLCAVKQTSVIVKAFMAFLAFVFNSSLFLLVVALVSGAYITLVPVFIPYTDPTTLFGYLPNILLQCALGPLGFFTFSSYDATLLIYGLHSLTIVELFRWKLRDFQLELAATDRLKNLLLMDVKVRRKLLEIIREYDEYRSYISEYSKLFRWPFAVAIIVNVTGIFLCLDFGLKVSFDMAFGASLGLFIQLLLPVIIELILTVQHDRMHSEIEKLSWHLLVSDANKKIYKQFLMFKHGHRGISLPMFGVADAKLIIKILCMMYCVGVHYSELVWFVLEEE